MVIWFVAVLLNTHMVVPHVFAVQYYDNVACFPNPMDAGISKEANYVVTAIWIIFGGLTPLSLVISIVVPIVALCYDRQNTSVSPVTSYYKGMAKLALFLVAGNLMNMGGIGIVTLLQYIADSEPSRVYLAYFGGFISLLHTPILILAFLKPVRCKLQEMLCCIKFQYTPPKSNLSEGKKRSMTVVVN